MGIRDAVRSEEGEVTAGPQVVAAQASEMAIQQIRDQMQQGALPPLEYTPVPADADPLTRQDIQSARDSDLEVLMGFVAREEREGFNARLQSSGIQNNADELWETYTTRYQEARATVEGGGEQEEFAVAQTGVDELERVRRENAIDGAVTNLQEQIASGDLVLTEEPMTPEEILTDVRGLVGFAAQGEGSRQAFDQRIQERGMTIDPQQLWNTCVLAFRERLGDIQATEANEQRQSATTDEERQQADELAIEAGRNNDRAADTIEDQEERERYRVDGDRRLLEIYLRDLAVQDKRDALGALSQSGVYDAQVLMNMEMQINIEEAAEQQGTETPDIDIDALIDSPASSAMRTAAQTRAMEALDRLREMQQQGMSEQEIENTEQFSYLARLAGRADRPNRLGAWREINGMGGSTRDVIASGVIRESIMRGLLRAGYMEAVPRKTSEDQIA